MANDDLPLLSGIGPLPDPTRPAPPPGDDIVSVISRFRGEGIDCVTLWVDAMTPEEKDALRARLGPELPWEQEGGRVSAPSAEERERAEAFRRKRLRRKATAEGEAA